MPALDLELRQRVRQRGIHGSDLFIVQLFGDCGRSATERQRAPGIRAHAVKYLLRQPDHEFGVQELLALRERLLPRRFVFETRELGDQEVFVASSGLGYASAHETLVLEDATETAQAASSDEPDGASSQT